MTGVTYLTSLGASPLIRYATEFDNFSSYVSLYNHRRRAIAKTLENIFPILLLVMVLVYDQSNAAMI